MAIAENKLNQQINAYLELLNKQQKEALLGVAKAFAGQVSEEPVATTLKQN